MDAAGRQLPRHGARGLVRTSAPPDKPETRVEVKKQEFDLRPSELPDIGSARVVGQEVDVSQSIAVAEKVELPSLPSRSISHRRPRAAGARRDQSAEQEQYDEDSKAWPATARSAPSVALDNITAESLRTLENGPRSSCGCSTSRAACKSSARRPRPASTKSTKSSASVRRSTKNNRRPQTAAHVDHVVRKEIDFVVDEPTDDLQRMKEAILSIPNDESGIEMTFTAIGMAAQKFARCSVPSRQSAGVMIVVLTDEVGEDEARLEECVKSASGTRFGLRGRRPGAVRPHKHRNQVRRPRTGLRPNPAVDSGPPRP